MATKQVKKETKARQLEGVVVGASENKTIRVAVTTVKVHSKYQKQYSTVKKYAAHDEKGAATVGQTVVIEACRPLSKTKRWRLVSVK